MKKSLLIFTAILLAGCTQKKNSRISSISAEDSISLEKELVNYKNALFSTLYFKSLKETYLRNNIDPNDFCYDTIKKWDLTISDCVIHEFDLQLYAEDKNKDRLIKKWMNKKKYIPLSRSPEYTYGSLDMKRSLDFYNSDDLKQYIDSLRQIIRKRLEKSTESTTD
jgi:hypothetical protein